MPAGTWPRECWQARTCARTCLPPMYLRYLPARPTLDNCDRPREARCRTTQSSKQTVDESARNVVLAQGNYVIVDGNALPHSELVVRTSADIVELCPYVLGGG